MGVGLGHKKSGGRKKGTPNKLTFDAIETLRRLNCDPIEGMARIAMDEGTPLVIRSKMYSDLAQYVYPKRKAIELSGPNGGAIEVDDGDARERLLEKINALATAYRTEESTEPNRPNRTEPLSSNGSVG